MRKVILSVILMLLIIPSAFFINACSSHKKYTITYMVDGEVYSVYETEGKEKLNLPILEKTGYDFIGWYYDLNDEATLNNETFKNKYLTSDIKVYAKFNAIRYVINYNLDNGINNEDNPTDYTIENSNITLKDAQKLGYAFDGWFTESLYVNKIEIINTQELKDYNLFAKFIINQYTISFNSNGGSLVNSITQNYNTAISQPINPTKNGFVFDGWYTDETFSNKFNFTTMPYTNIQLYAKWIPIFEISQGCIIGLTDFGKTLKLINIPNLINNVDITEISDNAFKDCESIINVIIPTSILKIGDNVFEGCDKLVNIYYEGTSIQFNNISLGIKDNRFQSVNIYFYVATKVEVPKDGGNYWYYGVDQISPLVWDMSTYSFNYNDVIIQKGENSISFSYNPQMQNTSVAYEYVFSNPLNDKMAIALSEIEDLNYGVSISFVYSDIQLSAITNSTPNYRTQVIEPEQNVYIYLVVSPVNLNKSVDFTTNIVWNYGKPGTLTLIDNFNNIINEYTIVIGQPITIVEMPTILNGYEFKGWYLDAEYNNVAIFPFTANKQNILYAYIVNKS